MTWNDVWKSLDAGEREAAAAAFCDHFARDSEEMVTAMGFLAETLRFRAQKIARLPDAKLRGYLAKARAPWAQVIEAMVRALHVRERAGLLIHFLDALGIDHHEGSFDGRDLEPPTREAIESAAGSLLSEYSSDRVRLYFQALYLQDDAFWGALQDLDFDGLTKSPPPRKQQAPAQNPADAEASEDLIRKSDPTFRAGRTFDTLDEVVIDRIVEAVGGIEGSLSADRVRDLVDTVLYLNRTRTSGYFHLGFLDVLQQVPPSIDLPEINDDRRRWYLCGALSGFIRRTKPGMAQELVTNHVKDFQQIGSGGHDGVSLAAPLLFKTLASEEDPAAFLEFVSAAGLAAGGHGLIDEVTDLASELLRHGRAAEAQPLLELALGAIATLANQGRPAPAEDIRTIERRMAHCLRMSGRFEEAEQILVVLLADDAGHHEGMIRTDLGLIASRMRTLEDVRLPVDPAAYAAFAERLLPGVPYFEQAAACDANRGAHGEYCLGVRHLAMGNTGQAIPLLECAVSEMQQRPQVYDRDGLLSRARTYLAYAIASAMIEPRARDIPRLMKQAVFRIGLPPDAMLREILVGLATMDVESAKALAKELEAEHADELLSALTDAELLRHFADARKALLLRGDDRTRAAMERFADYRRVYQSARRANDCEIAEDALGRMEVLSAREETAEAFLSTLDELEKDSTLWEPDEVDFARVRVLRKLGRIDGARVSLARIAHRWLGMNDEYRAAAAEEVVEEIRELGVDPSESLARRVANAKRAVEAEPDEAVKASVFFIGGDEREARYDESIRGWAAERWPAVALELEHPGWGSNWNKKLESWRTRMEAADVVVLMPYVRTTLGRHCRRACSEWGIPWVPCTSRGESGLKRSIGRAVTLVQGLKGNLV